MQSADRSRFLCAFLMVVAAVPISAQQSEQNPTTAPQTVTSDRQPTANPGRNSQGPQMPAAHYSPLAAAGGYKGRRATWYEELLRSLNPKNIDWGMSWE